MANNAFKMMTISKGEQSFTVRIDEDEYEKILEDPALVASYWQYLSKSDTTNTSHQDDKSSEATDDDITEIPVSSGEFQEKSDVRRREKGDKYRWKYDSTHLLIQLRKEMNDDFNNPEFLKRNLWKKVAKQMNTNGHSVNEDDCDKKWKHLVETYRKIKEFPSDEIGFPPRWQFYSLIHDIVGNDFNISKTKPKRRLVQSLQSLTSRTIANQSDFFNTADHIEETIESLNHTSLLPISSGIVNRSSCMCDASTECKYLLKDCCSDTTSLDPPQWFKEYEKKNEEKWDRWEMITHEKIEAIKDLTTIIKDLVESRNNI